MRKLACAIVTLAAIVQIADAGHRQTVSHSASERAALIGDHALTLQWLGDSPPGAASVTVDHGLLSLHGEQLGHGGGHDADYLRIDGVITRVDARSFELDGTIVTSVSISNGGKECKRQGAMTFRRTGKRRYWRLKQMEDPCDPPSLDYVDIHLR